MINLIRRVALAVASAATLSLYGCGGGGGGSTTSEVDVTVVDGAIQNATVCLDKNGNGACDADEPSGKTDASGKVKLMVGSADVGMYPVLAVVGTDATDADTGAVTVGFTLKAPASKSGVVSPLTTLVQTLLEGSGLSVADAETKVKADTGLNVSLFDDFTKGNSADQKAAGTIARLIVITTQQQTTALVSTLNTDSLDGSKITKEKLDKAIQKRTLERLPAIKAAATDPAVMAATPGAAKEAALAAQAITLVASSDLTPESVATVVAVNNQAPAPGAPEPTALEHAKKFLALFDASLATSFPGTGVSRAAFSDGCYLDDGTTKPVSIASFDVDRVLSGEENKFRIGSTRTNVQVVADRTSTNPDGSKRREIDVKYDVNYVDGTVYSDSNPAIVTTLISGSSSGTVMPGGAACGTPESASNLRFFGNRAVVRAVIRPWNARAERFSLATGAPQTVPVVYSKYIQFRISDPSNFATYVVVKGPGLPSAGAKMLSVRILRSDPLLAGKNGNFVNWLDTDGFRFCRLNGSSTIAADQVDCVADGASGTGQGAFDQTAALADSNFDALGFTAGASYTVDVYNDEGWKTINGQQGRTPIASYNRVLRALPYSAVALAGAGPSSDLFPRITSSQTAVQVAAVIRSKLAGTTDLSWTALGTLPDARKFRLLDVYAFENGVASAGPSFWPASRQYVSSYPGSTAGALSISNYVIPAASSLLVTPKYGEFGLEYTDRNQSFLVSYVNFQ